MTDKALCFCSPSNESESTHFSHKSLKSLIEIWNIFNKNKIKITSKTSAKVMYTKLDNVLKKYLEGSGKYWLWCGVIERLAGNNLTLTERQLMKIKRDLRNICKRDLKPEKPEAWYKNPKTWLSNYDIQNVMIQYTQSTKYKYAFLGVFPIDFSVISTEGTCMYSNFCLIDIKSYIKKGKKFIGLITNLDKHDESGSHWTSTFMVIDPVLKTYGAYYYDSTGRSIPSYLEIFLQSVKRQCEQIYPSKEFKIHMNSKQHQHKNTECGMFSMVFQIRWINKHIVKKNDTNFAEIVANPCIDDEHMLMLRDHLFRPNSKMELKKMKHFNK